MGHALQDGAHQLRLVPRRGRVLVAAALAVSCACSRAPKDPVQALLAELEAAAEARDADRFAERLSPGFVAGGEMSRADAVAMLRRYLAGYDSVALTVYGTEVERSGDAARVRTVVEFSGRARAAFGLEGLLPPEAVYRFDLETGVDGGAWRVRSARWEQVQPGSPAAAAPSGR